MTGQRSLYVVHVTKRYPAAVGGDATAVAALAQTLQRGGHRVTVVTSRSPAIRCGSNVRQVGLPFSDAALDGHGVGRVISCAWMVLWGLWFLARERPDIVHAHAPELGAAMALPARVLRIPRVLTLHGTSIRLESVGPKAKLERLLVRLGDYHRLFTVDPAVLPALDGLARTPPLFVPNGVTVEAHPAWKGPRPDAHLLFVGRLDPVKSVDILLTAMALARSRGCTAVLDIVGAGPLEPDLEQLASDLGLDGCVTFQGALPHAEVIERMAGASALVLPSRYEGFPLVLLEAWAVGLPVVVTAVGAVPHVCRDGQDALVVEPGNPTALAEAVGTLAADPALAKRVGAEGHHTVKRYGQRDLSSFLNEQYMRLLSAAL
jgi:glycosyltransferase involved in cell wall biosynthesis